MKKTLLISLLSFFISLFFSLQINANTLSTVPQLGANSVWIMNMNNHKTILTNNPDHTMPIASLTKLITAMVILDGKQSLDEKLSVDIHENKELVGVFSRLPIRAVLTRHDLLLLALMSSENRAAATLAHYYPGGQQSFVHAMNRKVKALGMSHTHFSEPTGLSSQNVSTARDLSKLLLALEHYPLIKKLSTTKQKDIEVYFKSSNTSPYVITYRNTNYLINKDNWHIQLTKTGFTNPAGHCLILKTTIANKPIGIILLNAFGKYTHFGDANRIKAWLETGTIKALPTIVKQHKV